MELALPEPGHSGHLRDSHALTRLGDIKHAPLRA